MKKIIFEINERDTGKQYKIYSNGEIEGFSPDSWVVNNHGATCFQLDAIKSKMPDSPIATVISEVLRCSQDDNG